MEWKGTGNSWEPNPTACLKKLWQNYDKNIFFIFCRNLQRSNSQLALSQPMRLNLAGRRNQFPIQFPRQALSLSRPQLNTQVYRQFLSLSRPGLNTQVYRQSLSLSRPQLNTQVRVYRQSLPLSRVQLNTQVYRPAAQHTGIQTRSSTHRYTDSPSHWGGLSSTHRYTDCPLMPLPCSHCKSRAEMKLKKFSVSVFISAVHLNYQFSGTKKRIRKYSNVSGLQLILVFV